MHGATVLPDGVNVAMRTTRNGKAQFVYTETFRASQFPSRKAMLEAMRNTENVARSIPNKGMTLSTQVVGNIARLSIRCTEPREDFADRMVAEFMAWGGRFGSITLSKLILTAMRFIAGGWQP
jgi:hypothetical protein